MFKAYCLLLPVHECRGVCVRFDLLYRCLNTSSLSSPCFEFLIFLVLFILIIFKDTFFGEISLVRVIKFEDPKLIYMYSIFFIFFNIMLLILKLRTILKVYYCLRWLLNILRLIVLLQQRLLTFAIINLREIRHLFHLLLLLRCLLLHLMIILKLNKFNFRTILKLFFLLFFFLFQANDLQPSTLSFLLYLKLNEALFLVLFPLTIS